MFPIRTIVHPTDFSSHSDSAYRLAWSLARDYNAHLIVAHVRRPALVVSDFYALPPDPVVERDALLEQFAKLRPTDPSVRVEHRIEEGDAATEILRLAQASKSDLIVMGTHGRSGLGRVLMGSVAEKILRKASCPVLTVKLPADQAGPAEPQAQAGGKATVR